MQKLLCIANHIRRTGKTATTENLAAALALEGEPAGIVRVEEPPDDFSFEWGKSEAIPNLFAATVSPNLLERDRDEFRALLAKDFPENGWLLLDAPSGIGRATRNALRASDAFLIPLPLEEDIFDRLAPTLAVLEWEEAKTPSFLGFLPSRIRLGDRLLDLFSPMVLPLFASQMIHEIIPEDPVIAAAGKAGCSVFEIDLLSPSVAAFRKLARHLVNTTSQFHGGCI